MYYSILPLLFSVITREKGKGENVLNRVACVQNAVFTVAFLLDCLLELIMIEAADAVFIFHYINRKQET